MVLAELSHAGRVAIGIGLAVWGLLYGLIAVAEMTVPRRFVAWRRAMVDRRKWTPPLAPEVGRFVDDLLGEPPELYARVRVIGAINLSLCALILTIGYLYLSTH